MCDELCESQSCVNCERLLRRNCPLIEFVLTQYRMFLQLSCDEMLSELGRKIASESAEALRQFLMRRGIFLTC